MLGWTTPPPRRPESHEGAGPSTPIPGTATDHQAMFMVLHAASLTLFPVSIMALRATNKASNPADIFLPILVASACSVLGGFLSAGLGPAHQAARPDPVGLAPGCFGLLATLVSCMAPSSALDRSMARPLESRPHQVESVSTALGTGLMLGAILFFLGLATSARSTPGMPSPKGPRKASKPPSNWCRSWWASWWPWACSAPRAAWTSWCRNLELHQLDRRSVGNCRRDPHHAHEAPFRRRRPRHDRGRHDHLRPDSFTGSLSSLLQGSTDTTLYVIALYAGAIGLKRTRHVLPCALIADLCGFAGAFVMAMLFFR
jgi:hypothetical protein